MQLDLFLGNDGVRNSIKTALSNGNLPHAILFTAPNGCGRGDFARRLAADYLYPQGGPAAQAVLRAENSELLLVEGEGKSGQIPVDRIRWMRREVFQSSLSAEGRVVWIKDAHTMAAPSANALLKVLEEPPNGVLFILTARDASSLPATIVSRCALYPLAPVSFSVCQQALTQALPPEGDKNLPHLLSVLYDGRLGLGLRALENQDRLNIVTHALQAAGAAGMGDEYTLLQVFSGYEGRVDGEREKREALLSDISDILATCLRGNTAPGIPAVSEMDAARLLPVVAGAQLAFRGNAAPKITFAALAIRMARAVKG